VRFVSLFYSFSILYFAIYLLSRVRLLIASLGGLTDFFSVVLLTITSHVVITSTPQNRNRNHTQKCSSSSPSTSIYSHSHSTPTPTRYVEALKGYVNIQAEGALISNCGKRISSCLRGCLYVSCIPVHFNAFLGSFRASHERCFLWAVLTSRMSASFLRRHSSVLSWLAYALVEHA